MKFEKHLFISYAHLDNQPLLPDQLGWITRFHESLQAILSMRIGRRAEIWRDVKLAGNDVFPREIVEQFPQTAVLVSVLTPTYVESEWCTREVREFCQTAEQTGGLVVDNKARVVKVIKTPVDSEDALPQVMREVLGYPFYTFDKDETPLELDPTYGDEFARKYSLKLAKLAWEIAQLLKRLEAGSPADENTVADDHRKTAVYLAECSYDCREAREMLEAELSLHGYAVLPDRGLPREEDAYVAAVESLLDRCCLSVHLVGSTYGLVPDGPRQESVVVLQNELAIRRSGERGLRRLIWLPEKTLSDQSRQQEFIEALRKGEAQAGADVITGDLESLKRAVHAALSDQEGEPVERTRSKTEGDSDLLYLICDERDRKATLPLRKLLKRSGLKVEIPLFRGDAAALRRANRDLLACCELVCVYYGQGNETWRRAVESDLRKMRSYRVSKPLPKVYTFLAPPATDDKEELIELERPLLINGLEGFPDAELRKLFQGSGLGA